MADGDPSPFGTGTSTAAAVAPVIEAPMTNPQAVVDMGMGFRAKHLSDFDARTKEVDNVFSKQQLNVDTMSKLLDDTTASLKRNREGRSNLPLMALGAGMLSSPGNFGTQLGAGIQKMVPAIQQQRGEEDDYQYKLAQLAMRRTGVENAPLQDKLAYLRALQVGDEASARAIEVAMLKAQGQTDKDGGKDARAAAQLEEKANRDAMKAAQDQVDRLGKDYFTTPQEREEELIRRYQQNARSLKVSEDSIKKFSDGMRTGIDPNKGKGMFSTPGDTPDDAQKAQKLGLPPKPTGYIYDAIPNPTERQKAYGPERASFEKEQKTWDTELDKNTSELTGLDRAKAIMEKYPGITGPTAGVFSNKYRYPDAARKELEGIFSGNQIHSVPQGQGAISDFERTLFAKASPNMENQGDANKNMIAIRQQIINDQIEKRAFISQYFGHYKTTHGADQAWAEYARSPEGRAGMSDPATGMVVPNPARISWKEYMSRKWGDAPQTHAEGGQHKAGGAVHLGAEWD